MQKKRRAQSEASKVRVLVVDDHAIVREGLAAGINSQPDLMVCATAASAPEALTAVRASRPDVVLTDLSLGNESGLELIKDLHIRHPELKILVLSMHNPAIYAERALRSGAHGYVVKDEGIAQVAEGIRRVHDGEIHVRGDIMQQIVTRFTGPSSARPASTASRLTDREMEILRMVGRGMSTSSIAQQLHRSIKTVETHRTHIKEKLGFESAEGLLKYAIDWARSEEA